MIKNAERGSAFFLPCPVGIFYELLELNNKYLAKTFYPLHLYLFLQDYRKMNKRYFYSLILALTISTIAPAQNNWRKERIQIPPAICYSSGKVERSYIPPPPEFLLKSGAEKKSEIIVTYSLFPTEAMQAFEFAVEIWETIIESEIPINVQANWRKLNKNTLGSAGPSEFLANFDNAPRKNRYYPVAVAEKITKSEINSTSAADIQATFNSDAKWYFGTDGKTPDKLHDFVTVVLHEIAHGLGFTGFFYVSNEMGTYGHGRVGDAASFDFMVVDRNRRDLLNTSVYPIPSNEMYKAFISNTLYLKSPVAIAQNDGKMPRLYAPLEYDDGSSIYHLNDASYPSNNPNSLMTHAIGQGEAIHDPGPITKGIMADIGWNSMVLDLRKPKDIETTAPIVFELEIESDFPLDTSSVQLFYSYFGLARSFDSIPFVFSDDSAKFLATLNPDISNGDIYYYIVATDDKNRTFYRPSEGMEASDTITIGPDNEAPVVAHDKIPYYILTDADIEISVFADDNLGIDTVFVEYSINGFPQIPFGLSRKSDINYSGAFNLDKALLNDGDTISYHITAVDASLARNSSRLPKDSEFSFRIEKIFEPLARYSNDFNTPTVDFIISDFDIYIEENFADASLHSPHPYPSPNKDNANFNFTTVLKHPIVLNENAVMSFDEIVLVEPGEVLSKFGDADFWDYVIVEGSTDNAKTWMHVIDGYDSGDSENWKERYNSTIKNQESTAVGIPEWYIRREINLFESGNFNPGDTVIFRFRLFSDPYAHGWGWTIDNLQIQQPVSAPATVLSPGNVQVYPNPVSDVLHVSIQSKTNFSDVTLEIYTLFGQKVRSEIFNTHLGEINETIDVGGLADGLYLLSVSENGHRLYSKKIIKK